MPQVGNVANSGVLLRRSCQAAQLSHDALGAQRHSVGQGLASDGEGFAWVTCGHDERGEPSPEVPPNSGQVFKQLSLHLSGTAHTNRAEHPDSGVTPLIVVSSDPIVNHSNEFRLGSKDRTIGIDHTMRSLDLVLGRVRPTLATEVEV